MTARRVVTAYRLRAFKALGVIVRRIFPREVRLDDALIVHLLDQTHGQPMRSKINVTLRAAVLAAQAPTSGYYSPAIRFWRVSPVVLSERSE